MIERKSFIAGAGALAACVVLGGCSWAPRNQRPGSDTAGGTASAAAPPSSDTASAGSAGPSAGEVDDGLVLVEGGTFLMGSPEDEAWRGADEKLHEVSVGSFYLAPRETTQAEYAAATGANPSAFPGESLPVESLTWLDAVAYCNALSKAAGLEPAYRVSSRDVTWDRSAAGYRLPTEAEWEYACRAGTATPFNTQTSISPETEANYYGHYPYNIEQNYFSQGNLETPPGVYRETTVEVDSFPPNAWGLYDMHGNVAEWVWDAYGPYNPADSDDPVGPKSGTLRVCRGGGWNDFAKNLRSAYRASLPLDGSSASVGLRVARNAQPLTGTASTSAAAMGPAGGRALIAFFSWSGNTRAIALEIASQTGFDVAEIELASPYSSDYSTVLEEAQRDQNAQARPELASPIDVANYDTVLLGYPNWWASIPIPIATLLESADFSGKTVVPFCSHGGGRLGQSVTAIAKLAVGAAIGEPLAIHYGGGSTLSADIAAWLGGNGLM